MGNMDDDELLSQIALDESGKPFPLPNAVRAIARKQIELETLLRRVHPGLFADDNDDTLSADEQGRQHGKR